MLAPGTVTPAPHAQATAIDSPFTRYNMHNVIQIKSLQQTREAVYFPNTRLRRDC